MNAEENIRTRFLCLKGMRSFSVILAANEEDWEVVKEFQVYRRDNQ